MATETINTTSNHNGTDTTIVVVPFGTVIGFRIWTDAATGVTRCFHILTEAAGSEAETSIDSEYFTAEAWRSHSLGLAAA